TARDGAALSLILAAARGSVRPFGGARHGGEHDLADAHARIELDGATTQVRKLESDLTVEPRIDEAGGSMHHDRDASDAAATFDARHEIGRHLDAFVRATESELPRLQYERFVLRDDDLFRVAGHRLGV